MINIRNLNVRDPYIYFEDGTYYLYASINNYNDLEPTFVCYKSKDLIEFEEPIYIFNRPKNFWATKDYWAPEMHKYNGKYYLFVSLKSDDRCRGTQIFMSHTPDGLFTQISDNPITPNDWECLDGTLFIENDKPYIIFCREWLEVHDGEVYVMELSKDLKQAVGKPILLFKASQAKWTVPYSEGINYVTDGPFIIKKDNKLKMIWSSYGRKGYAMGVCESTSILGPWKQDEEPIFAENGGHGMIFQKDGELLLTLHAPNDPIGEERIVFLPCNI